MSKRTTQIIVDTKKVIYKCTKCGLIRSPMLRANGRLPRGAYICPKCMK